MKYTILKFLLVFSGLVFLQQAGISQIERDTMKNTDIAYKQADSAYYLTTQGMEILMGNVMIRSDSTFMFCDSAVLMDTAVLVIGNVSIVQSDTVFIFADSAIYYPDSLIVNMFGYEEENVVLQNGDQKLFTRALEYDVENKIARYHQSAVLQNDRTLLRSRRGTYLVNDKLAMFYDDVVVQDSSFNLWADSLHYLTEANRAIFRGPTRIEIDSSNVYAEAGYYDIENEFAEFLENAQYEKGDERARADLIKYNGISKEIILTGKAIYTDNDTQITADSIIHNRETEISRLMGNAEFVDSSNYAKSDLIIYDAKKESFITEGRSRLVDPPMIIEADFIDYSKTEGAGIARGDVIWQDTSANTIIYCDEIVKDSVNDLTKAYSLGEERPLLENILDNDTLFLSADTLINMSGAEQDSNDMFLAYNDVKIFKSDFNAICDSLSFQTQDSIFRLFYNPYMWSDTTQFSGDSIDIILKNDKIDQVQIKQNGFIIDTPDNQFFNQVKGRTINVFFVEDELDHMIVEGNAESLYYILDSKDAYIGVSKTSCSKIKFIFEAKELQDILFYARPESRLTPMDKADHNAMRLSGFLWNIENKPDSVESIVLREKK